MVVSWLNHTHEVDCSLSNKIGILSVMISLHQIHINALRKFDSMTTVHLEGVLLTIVVVL